MKSKESTTGNSAESLEPLFSKQSLNSAEVATIFETVAAVDFDPCANPSLVGRILELNHEVINRFVCSLAPIPAELELMVVQNNLYGSWEILLRSSDEDLQKVALETGDSDIRSLLARHPRLHSSLHKLLLNKCFVLEKSRYNTSHLFDIAEIWFGTIQAVRDRHDYDPQLDDEIATLLLSTDLASSDDMWHNQFYYQNCAELMQQLSASPFLQEVNWRQMAQINSERYLRLSKRKSFERMADRQSEAVEYMEEMQSLTIDTLLRLFNSPVLENILQEGNTSGLDEVIQYDGVSDAGDINFGALRSNLKNISSEHKQAFAKLNPRQKQMLPGSFQEILFEQS